MSGRMMHRVWAAGLVLVACCGAAQVQPADETKRDVRVADASVTDTVSTPAPVDEYELDAPVQMSDPVPIPHGIPVGPAIINVGDSTSSAEGAVAGTGTLVYSNVLGNSVFGPQGATATSRIADDITTFGVPNCPLSSYTIRTTGDRLFDGSGANQPYSVEVAIYTACPNAGGIVIPGTQTTFQVSAENAGSIVPLTFNAISAPALPQSFYLSVKFSRDLCGVVVGAPADYGFSADRIDFPGTACTAGLGGFPTGAHASFYAEIRTSNECMVASPGYKSANQAGSAFTAGTGVYFAKSIQLGVPVCRLKAWEISHKGNGIIQGDLRSQLINADPANGGLITGTRGNCFSSGSSAQVCRYNLVEPIDLLNTSFFMAFRTTSPVAGPILTCRQPVLGTSPNLLLVHTSGQWNPVPGTDNCWRDLDITLFCEGLPPIGACCDMILRDQAGEAVCRDEIPEMNCAFPEMWVEGKRCLPVCNQGPNIDELCEVDDCPGGSCVNEVCVGGTRAGLACVRDDCPSGSCRGSFCNGGVNSGDPCSREADCPGGSCTGSPFISGRGCGLAACCKPAGSVGDACEVLTRNECFAIEPTGNARLFSRGDFCGEFGFTCPNPVCLDRAGECTVPRQAFCEGGADDGMLCEPFPPDGIPDCRGICIGGLAPPGTICSQDATCQGGICDRGVCEGQPGCENPACCTTVCNIDFFCCDSHWDDTCAGYAFQFCDVLPANDECSSTRPNEGARLVTVPGVYEGDGIKATSNPLDPGYCCHVQEPGAKGVGTVWYRFVATDTSARFDTCCTTSIPNYPGDDSLIQVFAVADPDRGVCTDQTPCSIAAQDCADGSECLIDQMYACNNLIPIGCNDDSNCSCLGFPETQRSRVCVSGLVPGDMYYVMVAGKSEEQRGKYRLVISSPCLAEDPLPNDFCNTAEVPEGQDVVENYPIQIPFDLSGETTNTAAATFDCPGPFCQGDGFTSTMTHDVWYDWTAPCSGTALIETCAGENTPDTGLVVYEGCDCPVDIGRELACSFFTGPPCFLGSRIPGFEIQEGQCYKFRLSGNFDERPSGDITITLQCMGCPQGQIEFLNPVDNAVDARQPFVPNSPGAPQGINSVTYAGPVGSDDPACWTFCETDVAGAANSVTGFVDHGDGTFTINLARPITMNAVTTLTYQPSTGLPSRGVFYSHPANVNGDSASAPSDILFLIDILNGVQVAPYGLMSSDVDRSAVAGPPDILRVIDLLNGAAGYPNQLNRSKPVCGGCCPL